MNRPIPFRWDGEAMVPLKGWAATCDREYVIGETYRLAPFEERSLASHNHYFAAIHEAWQNLPEPLAERFPTAEHLRKYAVIKAGYCDQRTEVVASKAEAQRIARFIRPLDEYAIVVSNESTVSIFTAKSQSMKAMGKKAFGESKQEVLEIVAAMVGVEVAALRKNAGAAA